MLEFFFKRDLWNRNYLKLQHSTIIYSPHTKWWNLLGIFWMTGNVFGTYVHNTFCPHEILNKSSLLKSLNFGYFWSQIVHRSWDFSESFMWILNKSGCIFWFSTVFLPQTNKMYRIPMLLFAAPRWGQWNVTFVFIKTGWKYYLGICLFRSCHCIIPKLLAQWISAVVFFQRN